MVKPLLLLLTLLTANTLFLDTVFHVVFGWDLMTGLLSCVAGGIADVSLIAMDMDADASTVAIMQTVRLAFVLAVLPSWIGFMTRNVPDDTPASEPLDMSPGSSPTPLDRLLATPERKTIFTLAVALVCGAAGYSSGVPAGALVFSLVAVAALNITTSAPISPRSASCKSPALPTPPPSCPKSRCRSYTCGSKPRDRGQCKITPGVFLHQSL